MALSVVDITGDAPVTIAEAREHLSLHSSNDVRILPLLNAAIRWVETQVRLSLQEQTLLLTLDQWPSRGSIRLPRSPVDEVSEISYLDAAGDEQTWDDAEYAVSLNSLPVVIEPVSGKSFPALINQAGAVTITYTTTAAGLTDDLKAAILLKLSELVDGYDEQRAACIASLIAPRIQHVTVDLD